MFNLRFGLAVASVALLCGCSPTSNLSTLVVTYNKAAQAQYPDRNPIIVVPGILGSKLTDPATGELVWGGAEKISVDPGTTEGLRQLALPIGDGRTPLSDLRSSLRPAGVIDKASISLFGLPAELEVYGGILKTLGAGGYVDNELGEKDAIDYGRAHYTCFQFAYDWRRDIVESAKELGRFIRERRQFVQALIRDRFGSERPGLKFDIITHSMGALVVRYYLMYGEADLPADGSLPPLTWAGARNVARVIYVAPPNAGSALTLLYLVQGRKIGPMQPNYPSALLATYPSVYQLLPRQRHKAIVWDRLPTRAVDDPLDPQLWTRLGWSLADPRRADVLAQLLPGISDPAERARRAAAFQAQVLQRTRRFFAAMDRPAPAPPGLSVRTVIGDGIDTPKTVAVNEADGTVRVKDFGPGDDTVLRTSSFLDERTGAMWEPHLRSPVDHGATMIISDDHIAITRNPTFTNSVLFWLLEERGQPR